MRPPSYLIRKGIHALPCIGDGRQSGTSGSASILNASPEAADGGGLALLQTGDRVRVDLNKRSVNVLVTEGELTERHRSLEQSGGYAIPEAQTPWQDMFRKSVLPFSDGMVLDGAPRFQDIDRKFTPRNNH